MTKETQFQNQIKIKMSAIFNHLKGNFLISGVGLGIAIISKNVFKREILEVSTPWKIFSSYVYLTGVTIAGKLTLDKLIELNWIRMSVKGKVPNEGFIGPIAADLDFIGPPHSG